MRIPIEKPRLTAKTFEELKSEVTLYLYKLTDVLDTIFANIDTDNLSPAFAQRLAGITGDVTLNSANINIASQKSLRVSDVVNSQALSSKLEEVADSGEGYLRMGEEGLICYGAGGASVTFPIPFDEIPIVMTVPSVSVVASATGFTSTSTNFSYIAVGQKL